MADVDDRNEVTITTEDFDAQAPRKSYKSITLKSKTDSVDDLIKKAREIKND